MGRERGCTKYNVSVAREREKKRGKKGKIGRGKDGEEKILVGILKFDIFEYAIESNHRIRVPTPLQFRPPIFVPSPSPLPPSVLFFFFNARPSARSKENQGEEKKIAAKSKNVPIAIERCCGITVLPFEALPFKLSKRARNVLIRELPEQTTRPIFPSSAGTGNFATREQVSPLQGDVVKNQSAL